MGEDGDAALVLPIRTAWTHRGRVHAGVGGGIVIDSTAEAEWEESQQKGRGLREALARARGAGQIAAR